MYMYRTVCVQVPSHTVHVYIPVNSVTSIITNKEED